MIGQGDTLKDHIQIMLWNKIWMHWKEWEGIYSCEMSERDYLHQDKSLFWVRSMSVSLQRGEFHIILFMYLIMSHHCKWGPSWLWSCGSWIFYYLYVQLVPITTNIVNLNLVHGEVYSIQHYVIKFVSDLRQVSIFLRKVAFNTINQTVIVNEQL